MDKKKKDFLHRCFCPANKVYFKGKLSPVNKFKISSNEEFAYRILKNLSKNGIPFYLEKEVNENYIYLPLSGNTYHGYVIRAKMENFSEILGIPIFTEKEIEDFLPQKLGVKAFIPFEKSSFYK